MSDTHKYWAFISYSHADSAWAQWLHRALESYRVPARLVGRATSLGPIPKKLFPVFRDRDELAGSPELGPALRAALRESRCLIVIASPRAAQSRWVDEEIRFFKSLGRSDRVFALVVDGEPDAARKAAPDRECFPPSLRFQVDEHGCLTETAAEPVAADVRREGDGKPHAKLKLIAGLLGLPLGDLKQRELQARNRRLAFVAGLSGAIAAVTIVLAAVALEARNDALRRQQQAEDLLQFMLGDLRDKLEPIGKLAILDAVGQKAMGYFATLDSTDVTDTALASRSRALRQIGDVRIKQGNTEGAREAIQEALKLDSELLKRHPGEADYLRNVANSQEAMGYAHYVKGALAQARPWFEQYAASTRELAARAPGNSEWAALEVGADMDLGALAFAEKNLDDAQKSYAAALSRQRDLAARASGAAHRQALANLAEIHAWLGQIEDERRHWSEALAQAREEAELRRQLLALAPDNAGYRYDLAKANLHVLYNDTQIRAIDAGDVVLTETVAVTGGLAKQDPDNVEYALMHLAALNYSVDAQLVSNRLQDAEASAAKMLEVAREAHRRAPASAQVLDYVVGAFLQAAKVDILENRRGEARRRLGEAEGLAPTAEQLLFSAGRWLELALLEWWLSEKKAAIGARAKADAALQRFRASGAALKPELMLRYEALLGSRQEAGAWFGKLSALERSHPFIRQFCRDTAACSYSAAASGSAASE